MDKQEVQKKFAQAVIVGTEMGFLVALPLVIFLLAGLWLDRKLGTIPLFTIVFILLSLVAVILELKHFILPLLEKRSQNKNKEEDKS